MKTTIHITTKGETYTVDHLNRIARPSINLPEGQRSPSDGFAIRGSTHWTLRGAMEFKFGRVHKVYTTEDIGEKRVPWLYKNSSWTTTMVPLVCGYRLT